MSTGRNPTAGVTWKRLVWFAGVWVGLALLFTIHDMALSTAADDPTEWLRTFGWKLVGWAGWAVCTPLVVAVAERGFPRPTLRSAAFHLGAALGIAGLAAILAAGLRWAVFGQFRARYGFFESTALGMAELWAFHLLVYAAVLGGYLAIRSRRAEADLTRARLDALTARLQPHFLFNTLNTVAGVLEHDPRHATRLIASLGELLRAAFERGGEQEVTLDRELELLRHYVAIQESRFGPRLSVRFDVDDSTRTARVPPLLLQPLVENAIVHGVSGAGQGREGTSRVEIVIRAERRGERLYLSIRDDGPGFAQQDPLPVGLGLDGTRQRLALRYGERHRLGLRDAPGGGALVELELPVGNDESADR